MDFSDGFQILTSYVKEFQYINPQKPLEIQIYFSVSSVQSVLLFYFHPNLILLNKQITNSQSIPHVKGDPPSQFHPWRVAPLVKFTPSEHPSSWQIILLDVIVICKSSLFPGGRLIGLDCIMSWTCWYWCFWLTFRVS